MIRSNLDQLAIDRGELVPPLLSLISQLAGSVVAVANGEAAVLRQGGAEEGPVDGGGGPEARQLHPRQRPVLLARRAQARRCVLHPSPEFKRD